VCRVIGIDEDEFVLAGADLDEIQRRPFKKIFAGIGDKHVNTLRNKMGIVLTLFVKSHSIDEGAVVLAPDRDAEISILFIYAFR